MEAGAAWISAKSKRTSYERTGEWPDETEDHLRKDHRSHEKWRGFGRFDLRVSDDGGGDFDQENHRNDENSPKDDGDQAAQLG